MVGWVMEKGELVKPLIQRQAIRAILITPDKEVLLMRIHEPGKGATRGGNSRGLIGTVRL